MHISQLGLSPAAHACLDAAGITDVEQLTTHPASDLLDTGHFGRVELHEIIYALNDLDLTLPPVPQGRLRSPRPRERQMLRLRLIERKTLAEIGQQTGVSKERVRQLLNQHFGLTGRR